MHHEFRKSTENSKQNFKGSFRTNSNTMNREDIIISEGAVMTCFTNAE